jgi:hypothetical protein
MSVHMHALTPLLTCVQIGALIATVSSTFHTEGTLCEVPIGLRSLSSSISSLQTACCPELESCISACPSCHVHESFQITHEEFAEHQAPIPFCCN